MYVLSAIVSLTLLGLVLGFLLGTAGKYLKVESSPIVDELESLLPGSQCGQCGSPVAGRLRKPWPRVMRPLRYVRPAVVPWRNKSLLYWDWTWI